MKLKLRNKLHWNLGQNTTQFRLQNCGRNVVCKILAINKLIRWPADDSVSNQDDDAVPVDLPCQNVPNSTCHLGGHYCDYNFGALPLSQVTAIHFNIAWWRHQMETFPASLALCFPSQRPVTRSFDAFFDLCLSKWLSKQSKLRWFETPAFIMTSL